MDENRLRRLLLARAFADFLIQPRAGTLMARLVPASNSTDPFYIFLTLERETGTPEDEYRSRRRAVMRGYSLALKLRHPEAKHVVIIATEPMAQKALGNSEDVYYIDISSLTPEEEAQARAIQTEYGFLTKISNEWRASDLIAGVKAHS